MNAVLETEIWESVLVSVIYALVERLIVLRTCHEEVFRNHRDLGDAFFRRVVFFFVWMNTTNQIKEELVVFLLQE
jgi:hypothetical protein